MLRIDKSKRKSQLWRGLPDLAGWKPAPQCPLARRRPKGIVIDMKRYLDPKSDLVFKRIFGEHPDLLRAFLNAILPLEPDERIVSLEYLPGEQVPEIPLLKQTLVDVRCRDERGRHFIVEMQMQWTDAFMQRVLFNASRAFVRQLSKGEHYKLLQPVIGLSLLDAVFDRNTDNFLHHFKMVNVSNTNREIEGLQLVFVELPKFHPKGTQEARELWLRFLNETGKEDSGPEDLRGTSREMDEALTLAEEAAFTPAQLAWHDRFWDAVSTHRTLMNAALEEGLAKGRALGEAEGRALGEAQGRALGEAQGRALGEAQGRAAERDLLLEKLMSGGMSETDARKLLEPPSK